MVLVMGETPYQSATPGFHQILFINPYSRNPIRFAPPNYVFLVTMHQLA